MSKEKQSDQSTVNTDKKVSDGRRQSWTVPNIPPEVRPPNPPPAPDKIEPVEIPINPTKPPPEKPSDNPNSEKPDSK